MKEASHIAPKAVYVITKASWGGAQRHVWDLIQKAAEAGYTPILVYGERGILSERAVALGVSVYHVPSLTRDISLPDDFEAFRTLYRIFSTFRPSVVHLHSSKASAVGALAARFAKVPHIIFTAHGWAFTESRSLASRKLFLFIHWITMLFATNTIAVSDAIKKHTERWLFVQNKIQVIKNGVSDEKILSREDARKELISLDPAIETAKLWIGTVAELHANKGLDVGIKAFQTPNLIPAEWIIVGAGEREKELREQSKEVPNIHFLGLIPDAHRYMKAFDIFFLPSRTEALGYVLLEAGMASLPVVATNVGGIPEIIEDGKTGLLVSVNDFESMNTALLALIENTNLRALLGEKLREHVAQNFSKENMLAETFKVYAAK